MPSSLHEIIVDMVRNQPSLAARLLTEGLGMRLPAFQHAEVQSNEFTDITPTEYRADAVLKLTNNGVTVLAVVVEAQLRPDDRKHWTWPVYLSTLRARAKCPAVLLVVSVDASTAAWCAKPIDLGHPGWVLAPLAIGPNEMPLVTDLESARQTPELACLSALAHAEHPDRDKVFDVFLDAVGFLDLDRRALYSDFVFTALSTAARDTMEALLSTRPYEYQSEFVRKYIFQGRAEGQVEAQVKAVLAVLEARGVVVPPNTRAHILECTDADLAELWLRRAATAETIYDVVDHAPRS